MVNIGAGAGGAVGQGGLYATPRPRVLPTLTGMQDPYGAPLPPLTMPGVPPPPPQLMGSLPFSPAADTCQFKAPFDAGMLDIEPPAAATAVETVAPVEAAGPTGPAYSARVIAAVDRTQPGGTSTALLAPVIPNDGPHPLSALLNSASAPTGPPSPPREAVRPATRAFQRQAPASLPGGSASVTGAPATGVAPLLPAPPMLPVTSSPGRRRVQAPRVLPSDGSSRPLATAETGSVPASAWRAIAATVSPSCVEAVGAGAFPNAFSGGASASPQAQRSVSAGTSAARVTSDARPSPASRGGAPAAGLPVAVSTSRSRGAARVGAAGSARQPSKKGKRPKGSFARRPALVAATQQPIPAMTPTFSVDKLHDGTPVLSEAGSALSRAVSVGLRPMRLDVNNTAANVEELTDNLNGFGLQLQTQDKMLEQMAKRIHSLKTETSSGLTEIKQKVGLDKGDIDAIKADLQAAKANLAELVRIRNRLRAYSKENTATTLLTRRVYLNVDHFADLMHMAIEDEL